MPVAYEFLFIKKTQTIVYYQITQIETTTAFPTSLFSVAVPFSGAGPYFCIKENRRHEKTKEMSNTELRT
jgi:hypothetical protein